MPQKKAPKPDIESGGGGDPVDAPALAEGAAEEGAAEDEAKAEDGTKLGSEGAADAPRKLPKKKRKFCCKLRQKRMHRSVKFAQFFMFGSIGLSIYSFLRPDWTRVATRRENFVVALDTPNKPCHGRKSCTRCLDGNQQPIQPLPNPDIVKVAGSDPTSRPDDWLPAKAGCGWCQKQQVCLAGMAEHPLSDIELSACPVTTVETSCTAYGGEATVLPNERATDFCGPQAVVNSTNATAGRIRPRVWQYTVQNTRQVLKPVDEVNYDYGYIDRDKTYVPPVALSRFPGWLQNVLECTGSLNLEIGVFISCQKDAGSSFCVDNQKAGGLCFMLSRKTGKGVDCDAELEENQERTEEDKAVCAERVLEAEKFKQDTGLDPQDADICAQKRGKEVEICESALSTLCYGSGQISLWEQMGVTIFSVISFALGLIAGYELLGNPSISPPVWQMRLKIIALFAAFFNFLASFSVYLALETWKSMEVKFAEQLQVPGCIPGEECISHGQGYKFAQYAGYTSFAAGLIMYQMVRKFSRRVDELHSMSLQDISGEIGEGMLEKEKDMMEDDEIDDMLRVDPTQSIFKESHDTAAKAFACFAFKDPSKALPLDLEIEIVFFNEGPVFKLAQPAPPAPPKSDDERRIMSWKSWAVVESCRAVDPELTAEHREAAEIEHKEDDELEEVVVVTKKGDFHFEVDDASAFVNALMDMLEKTSGGIVEGSGERVRGDAVAAYTFMDPEYVNRLPDKVELLVSAESLHVLDSRNLRELAVFKLLAIIPKVKTAKSEDDYDMLILDVIGLSLDYEFACEDSDVILAAIVMRKMKLREGITGKLELPKTGAAGFSAGAAKMFVGMLGGATDAVDGALDGAMNMVEDTFSNVLNSGKLIGNMATGKIGLGEGASIAAHNATEAATEAATKAKAAAAAALATGVNIGKGLRGGMKTMGAGASALKGKFGHRFGGSDAGSSVVSRSDYSESDDDQGSGSGDDSDSSEISVRTKALRALGGSAGLGAIGKANKHKAQVQAKKARPKDGGGQLEGAVTNRRLLI